MKTILFILLLSLFLPANVGEVSGKWEKISGSGFIEREPRLYRHIDTQTGCVVYAIYNNHTYNWSITAVKIGVENVK